MGKGSGHYFDHCQIKTYALCGLFHMVNSARLETDISPLLQPFAEVCRRKSRRFLFPVQSPGLLIITKSNDTRHVWLHDISEHGVGFCTTLPVEHGTDIILVLKRPRYGPLCLPATVAHSTEMGPNDWRIGCEFDVPITPEMLDGLL